jgi:hypothetical protein
MLYSFDTAGASSKRTTQYFEILANRAIYHDGWVACCFHGRTPWERSANLEVFGDQEVWELYHVENDFSQAVNVADQHPIKLRELQAIFDQECWKYNVYPLSGGTTQRSLPFNRPSLIAGRKSFTYYPDNVHMPEMAVANLKNSSFEMTAYLDIPAEGADGVVASGCESDFNSNSSDRRGTLDDLAQTIKRHGLEGIILKRKADLILLQQVRQYIGARSSDHEARRSHRGVGDLSQYRQKRLAFVGSRDRKGLLKLIDGNEHCGVGSLADLKILNTVSQCSRRVRTAQCVPQLSPAR